MPHGTRRFHIDFDFIDHTLRIGDDQGAQRSFPLDPMSVATFYRTTLTTLQEMALGVDIWRALAQADHVMHEAYSHELHSAGFWSGTGFGEAAFYTYAYPEPEGLKRCTVYPDAARYLNDLGEFVLPYEAVRTADDPDKALRGFL